MVERQPEQNRGLEKKFSQRALAAIDSAYLEAQTLGHKHFGNDHLLLGLIRDRTIRELLHISGYDVYKLRRDIIYLMMEKGQELFIPKESRLKPTFELMRALVHAKREAQNTQEEEIMPEELLKGIILEGKSNAAKLLTGEIEIIVSRNPESKPRLPKLITSIDQLKFSILYQ